MPNRVPKPYRDADPLVWELLDLRGPGVRGLNNLDGRRGALTWLYDNAQRAYPRIPTPQRAVEQMIRDAVSRIEQAPYREAAEFEFGLDSKGHEGIGKRRTRASRRLGVGLRAFQGTDRYEPALLALVAEKLRQVATDPAPAEQPPATGSVIARYDVFRALDELLSPRADWSEWVERNLIFVEGEPGTGKTTLVADYFRRRKVVWIQADTEDAMLLNVCRMLESSHDDGADTVNPAGARRRFATILAADEAPDLVVIDGWPAGGDLLSWLPPKRRSTIIVTTRQAPSKVSAPVVGVSDLTAEQAKRMITTLSPALEPHAELLARTLGGRARAIADACAFLEQERWLQAPEFCQMIRRDVVTALGAAVSPGQLSITAVYQHAIESLNETPSLGLLAFLAYLGHANVTEPCAMLYFGGNPRSLAANTASVRISYMSALHPLLALGIVRRQGDRLILDPLTAQVVRAKTRHLEPHLVDVASLCFCDPQADWELIEFWDLKDLGWTAADIASYYTMVTVAMYRLDTRTSHHPEALVVEPSVDDLGPAVDEEAQMLWQSYYAAFYFLNTGRFSEWVDLVRRLSEREHYRNLLTQWNYIQHRLREAEGVDEFGPFASKSITVDHITAFLTTVGVVATVSDTSDVVSWQAAIHLFESCQGLFHGRRTGFVWPYAKEVLEACFDLVTSSNADDLQTVLKETVAR